MIKRPITSSLLIVLALTLVGCAGDAYQQEQQQTLQAGETTASSYSQQQGESISENLTRSIGSALGGG